MSLTELIYFLGFLALTSVSVVTCFPAYGSLAGLSIEERDLIISKLQVRKADPPPGPSNDTSAKLVNDDDHPWKPLQPGDIRGPCPGLNTLASHGWLPAMVLLLLPKLSTRSNKDLIWATILPSLLLMLQCSWTATRSQICLVLVASLLKLVRTLLNPLLLVGWTLMPFLKAMLV